MENERGENERGEYDIQKYTEVLILNCPEIACPRVLLYVFYELCQAFVERGFTVKFAQSIQDLHNDAIVFMGDGIRAKNAVQLLNRQAPNALYMAWYWGKAKVQHTEQLKYLLHIHENYLNKRALPSHIPYFEEVAALPNTCPLLLRARERPEKVGTYERKPDTQCMDYCYMGWMYCTDMVPSSPKYKGIYHAVTNHAAFLPYDKRRAIYLSSVFALGFQSEENTRSLHVSQRIYEGLAYGCIVLTNSQAATDQTDGIAVYVRDKADVERKIEYYRAHPKERRAKQQAGYTFIQTKQGTNHDAANLLLKRAQNCFLPAREKEEEQSVSL